MQTEPGMPANGRGMRLPPHAVEAERAVLGGLMLDNRPWEEVSELVDEDDFYRRDHQLIFLAIRKLSGHARPDAVTVGEWLEHEDMLEEAGGLGYISKLSKDTPNTANIKNYAEIVRERSILRRLIRMGAELSDTCFAPKGRSVFEILEDAQRKLTNVSEKGMSEEVSSISEVMDRYVQAKDHVAQHGISGFSTGSRELDKLITCLERGTVTVLAGRPSQGKTAAAGMMIDSAVFDQGLSCFYAQAEQPEVPTLDRQMALRADIDFAKLRTGKLTDEEWERFRRAEKQIRESRLVLDASTGMTVERIRSKARAIKRKMGLDLLVVDYLSFIGTEERFEKRQQQVAYISKVLKELAKDLDIALVLLCQLNRECEGRKDKRPLLSDLREAGEIEQDADVAIFLYRDEMYERDTFEGFGEMIVRKQRNGPVGTVVMEYFGEKMKWKDIEDPRDKEEYFRKMERRKKRGGGFD